MLSLAAVAHPLAAQHPQGARQHLPVVRQHLAVRHPPLAPPLALHRQVQAASFQTPVQSAHWAI